MPSDTPLHSTPGTFVDRVRELAELRAGLEDARAGRGRFFLVTGEPGIGKTRLADEAARHAAAGAMEVLRAGCWEGDGAPAYWPVVQVIRAALGGSHREALLKLLGAADATHLGQDVAQLIPELQRALTASMPTSVQPSTDPEQTRFRLFDSVATVIRSLAAAVPLMLIVEDLHDADQATLLMLRFVVRQLKDASVLVLATYRDFEVQRSRALSALIGDLTREGTHIPLFALSREDTARMIEDRAGAPPSPRLVADVHQATAGNPLFIDGLVRVLRAEGSLNSAGRLNLAAFRVPDGVREAIHRWLAMLSDRSPLVAAATIGQEFELRCLQRVTQVPHDQLLDALREAAGAGLVTPLSRETYAFSHALIRNSLSEELNSAQRAQLHLKIGQAQEEIYQADLGTHLAELAYHFREGGEVNKAIDYSIRAGEAACAVFGYEEAAAHWRAALELMPNSLEDRERRADLLERLGELLGLSASEGALQFQCLEAALKLYQDLGRPEAAARVQGRLAAWLGTRGWASEISRVPGHSHAAEGFLREGSEETSLLWLHLGVATTAGEHLRTAEGLAAARQAMEISARLGNEVLRTRATIPYANHMFGSGRLAESLNLLRQASEKAGHLDDTIAGFGAATVVGYIMTSLYDPIEAAAWVRRELAQPRIAQASLLQRQLHDRLGTSHVLAGKLTEALGLQAESEREPLLQGQIAFYQGDWPTADLVLAQALDQARQGGRRTFACIYGAWLAKVRQALSRHADVEAILQEILAISIDGPHVPFQVHARQELALLYAQWGRPEQAHPHLAQCREILAAGEDWRGLAGHVARAEAAVAAAQARFEAADEQFASAVEIHRSYQVPFEEAQTLHLWGRALLAAGDRAAALEKLDAATDLYRLHGAGERWLETVEADRLRAHSGQGKSLASAIPEPPAPPDMSDAERNADAGLHGVFRKEGEYWTLSWEGSEARLRHRKGMHYIAWLLRHPGREFAATELISAIEPAIRGAAAALTSATEAHSAHTTIAHNLGDAGAALDAAAKAQYLRRLEDLRDELELAERLNDLGRAEKVRTEIEFIEAELSAALGLHGRDRKNGSHAERARLAVTKAIKTALSRIRHANPGLGRHLTLSIQTGYFCAYLPPHPVTWQLRTAK